MMESLGPGSHPRRAVGLGQVSFPLWSYLPPLPLWQVERNDGTQRMSQDGDILDSGWTGGWMAPQPPVPGVHEG